MGKAVRPKPARLAEKLVHIRTQLGLSQNGILRLLGFEEIFSRNYISAFETGAREPPLPVLLAYARLVGICAAVLIDDALDLPKKLPRIPPHHEK